MRWSLKGLPCFVGKSQFFPMAKQISGTAFATMEHRLMWWQWCLKHKIRLEHRSMFEDGRGRQYGCSSVLAVFLADHVFLNGYSILTRGFPVIGSALHALFPIFLYVACSSGCKLQSERAFNVRDIEYKLFFFFFLNNRRFHNHFRFPTHRKFR